MKLNLGAGPNWKRNGWSILDHKIKKNQKNRISGTGCGLLYSDLERIFLTSLF